MSAEVAWDGTRDLRQVGLGDAVLRVLEAVRELAVVGEDQEPLGVGIEAADMEQALVPVADEVTDVEPAELVVHRRDDTQRLVEGEVDPALVELDPDSVDVHGLVRPYPDTELSDDMAVDLDAAGGDQVLAH